MQKYNWNYPTTMWVGENRINDIAEACKNLSISKPLLVTDKGLAQTDIVKKTISILDNENISVKLSQSIEDLFQVIEEHTKNSVSFYEFVEDINSNFNKVQKLALIKLLWETAYADNVLEVNEERLIRRVADLIRIKSSLVLKLKEEVRSN